ncbi:MAG: DUF1553 domain-containing protein, partial [Chloroherpetonaceae bacterium]|nr:DUF1553 domain-containing protein [Chthonomonadaceae bacterium]MDW8207726.1 DUF1553 domain-containing protein [Chloroherpetonaceae bacterium]
LELARWVASAENPLTARVIVNRLWQYHFGQGIVRTPSNFGRLGERPTHPELLDWLASELIRQGWSLKRMHRLMLLSSVYRQASTGRSGLKVDPDNRLLWRMPRRRLEAEAIRDSLLAVSGKLDRRMGGPAERALDVPRRTLYLMTVRSDNGDFRALFDGADPSAPTERRGESIVASQALFLLNHPFVREAARALAERVLMEAGGDVRGGVHRMYLWLYGRPPSPEEVVMGQEFVQRAAVRAESAMDAWGDYAHLLLCANEFLYVD